MLPSERKVSTPVVNTVRVHTTSQPKTPHDSTMRSNHAATEPVQVAVTALLIERSQRTPSRKASTERNQRPHTESGGCSLIPPPPPPPSPSLPPPSPSPPPPPSSPSPPPPSPPSPSPPPPSPSPPHRPRLCRRRHRPPCRRPPRRRPRLRATFAKPTATLAPPRRRRPLASASYSSRPLACRIRDCAVTCQRGCNSHRTPRATGVGT
jgi:hypothetical protein